jgi:hypothetical protein
VIEKIIVENISRENNNTEYITKKEYCELIRVSEPN